MERFGGLDLKFLNILTKYPSIPTYHVRGDKGRLTEEVGVDFSSEEKLNISEKIDGTNGRIIVSSYARDLTLDYLIGSREEILYAKGDYVITNTLDIVKNLMPEMILREIKKRRNSDWVVTKRNSVTRR